MQDSQLVMPDNWQPGGLHLLLVLLLLLSQLQ